MTTKAMTNGNGSTTPDTDSDMSLLEKINADFEANFKGKTSKARKEELVKAYIAATKRKTDLESQIDAAAKAESEAATAIMREVTGTKKKIEIGDMKLSPMTRKDRVFFRKESAEVIKLG